MRKLLILAVIAGAAYYLYSRSLAPVGVYAEDGTPRTILFTTAQCGSACDEMRRYLKRRTDFEELDAFDNASGSELYKSYGGTGYLPYIVMGRQRVTGHSPGNVISAIAAEFGPDRVRASERRALQRNFDLVGKPRVVMYATAWCGYCDKAREYFLDNGIDFVEFDIEEDREAKRDYDALLGSGTPLLYFGYARINGFDRKRIEKEFDL